MAVDVDKASSIWLLIHQMVVPDFVVERARFHVVIKLCSEEFERGLQISGSVGAAKGLPVPTSAGQKTATAAACGRPEQSAELWKPWQLYSHLNRRRQRTQSPRIGGHFQADARSAVLQILVSPRKRMLASERSAASAWPPLQASSTRMGMKPRSAPWRTVGLIPVSVATPQMMKLFNPQSRSAMASGVPSKADIVIVSNIASSSRTLSSGASKNPELSLRNHGWTSSISFFFATPSSDAAEDTGKALRQRHVTHEKNAYLRCARDFEQPEHACEYGRRVTELAQNADLHVVDNECGRIGVRSFNKRFGNREAERALHGRISRPCAEIPPAR